MVWQENKSITLISNFHDPTKKGAANWQKKMIVIEVTMPQLVQDCNKYMVGCDKNDPVARLIAQVVTTAGPDAKYSKTSRERR